LAGNIARLVSPAEIKPQLRPGRGSRFGEWHENWSVYFSVTSEML
jgi:hypothetical protein